MSLERKDKRGAVKEGGRKTGPHEGLVCPEDFPPSPSAVCLTADTSSI